MRNRSGLLSRSATAVALGAAAVFGGAMLTVPAQASELSTADGACPYVVNVDVANVRTTANSTADNVSHHLYRGDQVTASESIYEDRGSGDVNFRRISSGAYIATSNLIGDGQCAYP